MDSRDRYIISSVKTAIWGLFLTLLMGLLSRELTRSAHKSIPISDFIIVSNSLEIAHGHILMFFVVIPLVFAVIVFLLKEKLDFDRYGRIILIFTGIYHLGALLSISLTIYKGFGHVYIYESVKNLELADKYLFGGVSALRIILYSVAHITMAVGVFGIGISILRSIRKVSLS